MFQFDGFGSDGCDYERFGCQINEGDVVLDIGANIGVFAHRAETKGASKVICFEPMTPTFECLIKNKGPKTTVYKNAVGGDNRFINFKIHSDFTQIGGATVSDDMIKNMVLIYDEMVYMINVNDIFNGLDKKIDFMKVDIEGGELELLNSITDENISVLRCLALELHIIDEKYEKLQHKFWSRMFNLGYQGYCLFHGDGKLRTLNFWKK
jgi:FkbM family methyltransferase